MNNLRVTRTELKHLALLIRMSVVLGQETLNHGQVTVADARRALVLQL